MTEETSISLRNISKVYKQYSQPVDRLKEILLPRKPRVEEFWALRDINLEIPRGQTVGIIGRNGSGKSTLLQIIAGTLTPTTGQLQVNGRVSALLELGSGFNPEFTGRQNVFFNGRILGLSQEEIESRFDEIAAFADIGDFIDQPVKTYSSGMFVRLAFAVAVNVDPTILIVDEALAVGDIYFQQKCFEKIRQLKESGNTLLFVSHDASAIYKLCSRAILLEHGQLTLDSRPRQVLDLYEAKMWQALDQDPASLDVNLLYGTERPEGNQEVEDVVDEMPEEVEEVQLHRLDVTIQSVQLLDADERVVQTPVIDQLVKLVINLQFNQEFEDPHVGFKIRDRTGFDVFAINSYTMNKSIGSVISGESMAVSFEFFTQFSEGEYTITIGVTDGGYGLGLFRTILAYIHNVLAFKVLREPEKPYWAGIVSLNPKLTVIREQRGSTAQSILS
jgi:lipopolysaccharide transport system ATP-binding protein